MSRANKKGQAWGVRSRACPKFSERKPVPFSYSHSIVAGGFGVTS